MQRRHVGGIGFRGDVTGVTYAAGVDVTALTLTVVVVIAGGAGQIGSVGQLDFAEEVDSAGK